MTCLPLPPLSGVDLDDLLHEVLGRVGEVVASRERLRALLDAVVAIGADLDLRSTLQRIVESACRLTGVPKFSNLISPLKNRGPVWAWPWFNRSSWRTDGKFNASPTNRAVRFFASPI